MDKTHLLTVFNKQFKELVEDIARVFPDNKDILTLKLAMGQILLITPKLIYKGYKKHVVDKYRSEILAGDINFFIEKDYNKDMQNLGGASSIMLDKIDCLREPVRNMNPLEQANVIKYMQNMLKLSDLYEEE
uniref:Uncharacterized protein n=1 Tax=viral metagenome TaxID=1070528 RepID=A0A6C0II73_9ZZZZ